LPIADADCRCRCAELTTSEDFADRRDSILGLYETEDIMICVSRAKSAEWVLDI
jgi:hypothetical protein